ncbi:MAG: 2-oxoacid:acceptor oxidoreductase family protein [Desulfobacteraceae bacterium]|nr:2-oxoacid:acceptor oxidoreductase family protein [Desulfobacteraceae bacterium]
MQAPLNQQIVISGVGGQGVLFVTRLLAEAAIAKGLAVLSSETHGMAQRGGTVLSHFKVGDFSSPLIRPGHADLLLALKAEGIAQHAAFLKPDGWIAVNAAAAPADGGNRCCLALDADRLARAVAPKAVNLILLGFALAASPAESENPLFCDLAEIQSVLQKRLDARPQLLENALAALAAGAAAPAAV